MSISIPNFLHSNICMSIHNSTYMHHDYYTALYIFMRVGNNKFLNHSIIYFSLLYIIVIIILLKRVFYRHFFAYEALQPFYVYSLQQSYCDCSMLLLQDCAIILTKAFIIIFKIRYICRHVITGVCTYFTVMEILSRRHFLSFLIRLHMSKRSQSQCTIGSSV